MHSVESLLGMIITEAAEERYDPHKPRREQSENGTELPPIQYDLELVRYPDGSLEWVD